MKYYKGKKVGWIYYQSKVVAYIYHLGKLVYQSVRSCFGGGKWDNTKPWVNEEAWNNGNNT